MDGGELEKQGDRVRDRGEGINGNSEASLSLILFRYRVFQLLPPNRKRH